VSSSAVVRDVLRAIVRLRSGTVAATASSPIVFAAGARRRRVAARFPDPAGTGAHPERRVTPDVHGQGQLGFRGPRQNWVQ
jgi:hypothetical protein